jgi:hypothetical protein
MRDHSLNLSDCQFFMSFSYFLCIPHFVKLIVLRDEVCFFAKFLDEIPKDEPKV